MPDMLITGAHGFISQAVQSHLADDPAFHVDTVSLRTSDWRSMNLARYDCILHTAGIAHVRSDAKLSEEYGRINHQLTVEVAKKAKADGVKQFIFLSSMIVFGEAAPAGVRRRITQDTVPAPANPYGHSKLDAENDLRRLEDDHFVVAILRPPMVYGTGCKGNYNTLVKLARKLPIFPEFHNERSMLYVENLAELIRLIALRRDRGTFHPQDDEPRSVSDIVRVICAAHGKTMHFSRALSPLVRLVGQRGLARRAFGDMVYDSKMSIYPENYRIVRFEEAIRRTEGGNPWQA